MRGRGERDGGLFLRQREGEEVGEGLDLARRRQVADPPVQVQAEFPRHRRVVGRQAVAQAAGFQRRRQNVRASAGLILRFASAKIMSLTESVHKTDSSGFKCPRFSM